jgi:hypothetical protein
MKRTLLLSAFLLALSFFSFTSQASAQSDEAKPQRILKNKLLFQHGKVLVVLPKTEEGKSMLRTFEAEDFDRHYGDGARPEYAFIDDSTDSRFSISVTKSELLPSGLEAYKTRMEKSLEKAVKDIIWHKKEILKLGETDWVHLEMQNKTTDGSTVMNDFYVTSMGGHPLMFTVTTNTKHWYEMRKVTQKMMLSVTVHEKDSAANTPQTTAKPVKETTK